MNFFKLIRTKSYIIFVSLIFIFGIILRVLLLNANAYNIVVDECHSLFHIDSFTYKDLFFKFMEGANFLPGYHFLLKIIHSLFGYNFLLLKVPSLLLGIFSIFIFYRVIKQSFNNSFIVMSALFIFATNYNLIYYSTQIKPYIFDVCIVLIILNSAFYICKHYQEEKIPIAALTKYIIFSILFCYTSLTSIVILELYWVIFFIIWYFKKSKNIINALIFQFFISIFIIFEYFAFIIQIHYGTSLKDQWLNNGFYFNPSSLDAKNSLIHFSHFNFYWFDKDLTYHLPSFVIILYIVLFFLGVISFLIPILKKEHDIKGLFIITPFLLFITLSFLYIYPFCNRLIIFLIPFFIIIELKVFDIKNNKILKYCASFILLFIIFIYCRYVNELYQIRGNIENSKISENTYSLIKELENENNDKVIISSEDICTVCLNTKSIMYVDINKSIINKNTQQLFISNPKQINDFNNKNMTSLSNIIQKKQTIIYTFKLVNEKNNESEIISEAIKNLGYKQISENYLSFTDSKIFKRIDN